MTNKMKTIIPKLTRDGILLRWGLLPLTGGVLLTLPWCLILKKLELESLSNNNVVPIVPMLAGVIFAILAPLFIGMKYGVAEPAPKADKSKDAEIKLQFDSIRNQWRNTTLFLLGAVAIYGYTLIRKDLSNLPSHETALFVAWTIGVLWLFISFVGWVRSDSTVRPIAEVEAYFSNYCDKFSVRYSIAVVFICAGIWLAGEKPNLWWVCVPAGLSAAFFARELSILAIVAGVGTLLFQGIASLPVSVAVVLGAFIIASAIGQRRGS